MLYDQLNRPIHDLRISVIDRCNFRCPYCMPEHEYSKNYTFLKNNAWLSYNEIELLVKIFVELGARKVRLTGGEPLLRPNLPELIARLTNIKNIEDLALTTNGSLLAEHAAALKGAGLKRLTVSLDSLDSRVFKSMSGAKGTIKTVLDGITAAEKAGFSAMKINVVVQKGVNDHTILDLVDRFRKTNHVLRFIEYMDVGNCNHWQTKYVVPSSELIRVIDAKYPLTAADPGYFGEVASRYRFTDGGGEVGFISSVSQPFCTNCTRARISAEGKMYTCLFAEEGVDLRPVLVEPERLRAAITEIWQKREDRYSELRSQASRPKPSRKVEMFQIGG